MSKKLDIYTDASLFNGGFGIGLLAMSYGEELMKVSEIIPSDAGVKTVDNAELFGVCKAFKIVNDSGIRDADITIYTDSLRTINAVFGQKFKNIQEDILNELKMLKTITTEILGNRLYISKISSADNHKFAHRIAQHAAAKNTYTIGSIENSKLDGSKMRGMDVPGEFLKAGQQFQNLINNISYKETKLNELENKITGAKKEIDKKRQINERLVTVNELSNAALDTVTKDKYEKENVIFALEDALCSQRDLIEKLSNSLKALTKSLNETKNENRMRIKFLKEDYQRLSIKSLSGNVGRDSFVS